jgi:N-acetylmuramoyl-L-alanine amidase
MPETLPYIQLSSPNQEDRHDPIEFIVLHSTQMASDTEALERLCCPEAKVSCHYFIDQQGTLYQLVPEEKIAWHAGVSEWQGKTSLNKYSLGIEISNPDAEGSLPYHECQYITLEKLLKQLMAQYNIPAENVLGHCHISPGRKTDPNPHFNWQMLIEKGLTTHSQS